MNSMERMLNDEITRLMDRLATSVPEGGIERMRAVNPTLRRRLDEMETVLTGLRSDLIGDYRRWSRALDDLENLWALAAWRSAQSEEAPETASPLAA
jgi:hypothetical protein